MLKRYILLIILCTIGIYAKGFDLAGSFGYYSESFNFSYTGNTVNYSNQYGTSAKDMCIQLALSKPMKLTMTHTGSALNDTRLYVLTTSMNLIARNRNTDDGVVAQAYLEVELGAGTYYIVSEGNYIDGSITLNVQGIVNPLALSINAGNYSSFFTYSDTKNTASSGTSSGWNDYDISYKFTIARPMNITVSNCGSEVSDTYLYLLDSSQNIIYRNDNYVGGCSNNHRHAYINANLQRGTYYVVSEGLNEKGRITTTIEGTYSEPEYYDVIGDQNSSFFFSDVNYAWISDESFLGPSHGDIFYQVTLGGRMFVEVSNCGSYVEHTNIYILDVAQNIIASSIENPGGNTCSNPNQAYLKTLLESGVYYIVCETAAGEGDINIDITGTLVTSENEGGDPNAPNPSNELSARNNYILTVIPTVPTTTINGLNAHNSMQKVQYYDGLGRSLQQTQRWGNPDKHDLVSHQEYDFLGRKLNSWLPVAARYNNGKYVYKGDIKAKANTVYQNDADPYSKPVYENSPLNRIVEQYGPGQDWYNRNIAVRTEYLSNNSGLPCRFYKTADNRQDVSITKSGDYPSNQLYVIKQTDEENNVSYEFKDKLGQVILTRQMDGTLAHDTYYLYDSHGNLKAVLPPLAVDGLSANTTWQESNTLLQQYAYLYKYDDRNRCIAKKMPGADWVYYIYDKANRLIFTQDGEQRYKDEYEWTITIPDKEGRIVLAGTMYSYDFYVDDENNSGTIGSIIDLNDLVACISNGDVAFYAEYTGGYDNYGYSFIVYNSRATEVSPTGKAKLVMSMNTYKVNYYDNYQFLGRNDFPNYSYDSSKEGSGYGVRYTGGFQTILTGTIVSDEFQNEVLYSTFYYDDRERMIQSHHSNHLYGKDSEYIAYNFVGLPTQKMLVHTASEKPTQTEYYTYNYDHLGRLLETKHKLNTGTERSLAKNIYDELGRLSSTIRNEQANLADNNTYNIRSWLSSKIGPQFNEYLTYGWDGNIATMQWAYGSDARQYTFGYDGLSRLKSAAYTGVGYEQYNTSYTYDKQGNITNLVRYGRITMGTTASSFGIVDNLRMDYSGNQLVNVAESGPNVSLSQSNDFKKYSATNPGYTYNKNGAMTKDLNKGISEISYNSLNLPIQLDITNPLGTAKNIYTYVSDGRKLRVVHRLGTNLSTIHTTDYVGNKIYENGSLKRILVDGGYIENGMYHFYFTDHLGNNRAVVNTNGVVIQRNHYYPFGMTFAETSSVDQDKQPYQYNGKELDRRNGLNLYDYSARYMEPALGRFTAMDPLAEKKPSQTPYNYCSNNPITRIDPDGKDDYIFSSKGQIIVVPNTINNGSKKDRLFANNKRFIEVSDKSFLPGLSKNKGGDYLRPRYYNFTENVEDAVKVFKFAADNTNVEYKMDIYSEKGKKKAVVATNLNKWNVDKTDKYEEVEGTTKLFDIHSHSDEDGTKGGSKSDMKAAEKNVKNAVYHKNDQILYEYDDKNERINSVPANTDDQILDYINAE